MGALYSGIRFWVASSWAITKVHKDRETIHLNKNIKKYAKTHKIILTYVTKGVTMNLQTVRKWGG